MKKKQEPFKKTATIYKSEKFISIEPLSGANILTYREDNSYWMYLELSASDEILGQALSAALARSRFVDDKAFFNPDRAKRAYANWQTDFMKRYGYKTKQAAYKSLNWCLAKMSEGKISIEPHQHLRLNAWRALSSDRVVVVPATDDAAALGAALRLALDRCE